MRRILLVGLISQLLTLISVDCRSFFVDPKVGDSNNLGSAASPWKTLQEVFEKGKIRSQKPAKYPYSGGELVVKNPTGVVVSGDTILLRSGYHGEIEVQEYYNNDTLFIKAAPGENPHIGWFQLRSGSKWKVEGLTISPSFAKEYKRKQIFSFASHSYTGPASHNVVQACTLYSVENSTAWSKEEWNSLACNGIELDGPHQQAIGNVLKNVNFGIGSSGDFVTVLGNQVINFSGDGLRGLGNDQLWEGNLVKNCYKVNDNHDDGFQSWSLGSGGVGTGEVARMVLRGNTFINTDNPNQPLLGSLQGIGCFDGMFRDWLIENNIIITDHWHGITLLGAINCKIIHNTVIDEFDGAPGPTWISIDKHKNGILPISCLVANNLSTGYNLAKSGVDTSGNVTLKFKEYNAYFTNFSAFDLSLKENSPAISRANPLHANGSDILGILRPQGSGADAGAYEYLIPQSGHVFFDFSKNRNNRDNRTNQKLLIGVYHLKTQGYRDTQGRLQISPN